MIFIIVSCGLFSKLWLEISGRSTNDILRQFYENNMKIAGSNNDSSVYKRL